MCSFLIQGKIWGLCESPSAPPRPGPAASLSCFCPAAGFRFRSSSSVSAAASVSAKRRAAVLAPPDEEEEVVVVEVGEDKLPGCSVRGDEPCAPALLLSRPGDRRGQVDGCL